MHYKTIVNKFVEEKLVPKKIPFYSCGLLCCSNKNIKPEIEVVVKRPQRFDIKITKNIPRKFMGLKVKIV